MQDGGVDVLSVLELADADGIIPLDVAAGVERVHHLVVSGGERFVQLLEYVRLLNYFGTVDYGLRISVFTVNFF